MLTLLTRVICRWRGGPTFFADIILFLIARHVLKIKSWIKHQVVRHFRWWKKLHTLENPLFRSQSISRENWNDVIKKWSKYTRTELLSNPPQFRLVQLLAGRSRLVARARSLATFSVTANPIQVGWGFEPISSQKWR